MKNKVIDLTTFTQGNRVKFELPMPYYLSEQAVGYMDTITGDCFFFQKDGKYWTYKNTNEMIYHLYLLKPFRLAVL